MRKRIFLTGASGTVGYEVLKQLHQQREKYEIVVFDIESKKVKKKIKPFQNDITVCYGSITDLDKLETVCKGIDVVIHLAAIIPPFADENEELSYQVNVHGTKNLLQALQKYSPNAFFMYSSSVSVYGDRLKDPYIKVQDPLLPSKGDNYAITKIHAENLIINSTLNWSIFRLGAIMGGHKLSKLMFCQPLETSMEIATPEDTARVFVNGITHQKQLSKQIFNLGGGELCRISYENFLKRSFNIYGLGELNFVPMSFAQYNFHCGFYADGDVLEQILSFRKHTLEDYFKKEEQKISSLQKFITFILKTPIKFFLQKQSEPLLAFNTNNKEKMRLFFNQL